MPSPCHRPTECHNVYDCTSTAQNTVGKSCQLFPSHGCPTFLAKRYEPKYEKRRLICTTEKVSHYFDVLSCSPQRICITRSYQVSNVTLKLPINTMMNKGWIKICVDSQVRRKEKDLDWKLLYYTCILQNVFRCKWSDVFLVVIYQYSPVYIA